MEAFEKIKALIAEAEEDLKKAEGGNKAAGTRVRQAMQQISRQHQIEIGTFGHAGDGNLHPTIMTDKRDRQEWERVEAAIADIFDKALGMGGTLSGEHGTGIAKSCFLEKETSPATILYSKRVKEALDPNNILNPGKIIG